jgi:methionyl-tRNA formyltransferase
MKQRFRVVFMGTPDFSVPALDAVHAAGHDIVLVVTQPDKPRGRGRKLDAPPVKKAAIRLKRPVIQPASLRDETIRQVLKAAQADFFVVVAFGHILTQTVLDMPKHGCINVHASLLPRYRGPAPIHWAVINGEKETGVTTMLMDKGLDTGDILLKASEPVAAADTAGSLHDRLAVLGARLLCQTLDGFAEGTIRRIPQDHSLATYAPLLKKTDGLIDWQKPAALIESFIRGMNPWPGAFTFWGNRRLKIFRTEATAAATTAPPGTIIEAAANELTVATGRGRLAILEIQEASGSRLPVSEFLRGFRIAPGDVLA